MAPADEPTTLYEQYGQSLLYIMDKHALVIVKSLKKPAPAWITDEYQKCLCNQYSEDCGITFCKKSKAKFKYYLEIVHENSNNPKVLW